MSIPRNRFPLVLWKHIFVLGSIFGLISSGCGSASSTKLAAPTDLKVQASGPKLLTITWNDNNNNEDGFKIERKVEGETFEVVATVLANVTSYRDNELAAQTYYYRVKAYNSSGDSDYSEEISYTIAEATISVPANLLAQSTQPGEISLSWTDNSDNEDGFTLQRKSANDAYSNIAQLTADVSSYTDTNLVNGETYYYQIKAFNQTQESEYSNEASATVIDEPAETVPAAPSRLSAKADSDSRITLTWRDNADNELGFKIERKTGAAAFTEIATVAANIRTYVNKTGLSASTNYTYRVMAYNSKGNSPYSNEVSAATESPPMQIPAAPSNLSASAISASQIKLSWSDNADNESLFKIERSIDGESFEQIATTNANVLTYSDSSLNASTKYTYRVRANNQAGDSDYSNLADATTNGSAVSIPEAPSSLQANSNSSSQITLSWTDNSNNEEKFLIERHIEGEDFAQIGMTTANAPTYVDTSLSSSTTYYYRIRANNTAGNSEYSAEASAQTLPAQQGTAIIIDHTTRKLDLIPAEWIQAAKSNLHIAYGHTSHGSQIITGIDGLVGFRDSGDLYAWRGIMDLRDTPFSDASDLGTPSEDDKVIPAWETATRNYLESYKDEIDVVMWSWCGQVSGATELGIELYIKAMNRLEGDYPNVKFVYMTGHLDGTGLTGNLHLRNEQIREYCRENGKILYDFADIETYDPDGVYYGNLSPNDNCDYRSNNQTLNWATQWQNSHEEGVDWYDCSAAHSQALNANLKAYAAWWLWARLAGWSGPQ